MTPTELTAKARRAAEWWEAVKGQAIRHVDNDVWRMGEIPYGRLWSTTGLIRHCEEEGWQDDHVVEPQEMVEPCADEGEALDCCARGMTQFMDEVDPEPIQLEEIAADGVEWNEWRDVGSLTVYVHVPTEPGQPYWWEVWCSRSRNQLASGTAPTREEARRQAVEAARGMNNEDV